MQSTGIAGSQLSPLETHEQSCGWGQLRALKLRDSKDSHFYRVETPWIKSMQAWECMVCKGICYHHALLCWASGAGAENNRMIETVNELAALKEFTKLSQQAPVLGPKSLMCCMNVPVANAGQLFLIFGWSNCSSMRDVLKAFMADVE